MKTSKAIQFFKTHDVTKDQGYNILIEDLWNIGVVTKPTFEDQQQEAHTITEADMARPEAQAVIAFFMYQIQDVLFPVISDLRQTLTQVEHTNRSIVDMAKEIVGLPVPSGLGSYDVDTVESNAKTPQERGAAQILRMSYEGINVDNPKLTGEMLRILAGCTVV